MAPRKRIGLLYNYDENWIGGTYYVQNLIRSLRYLPKDQQATVYVLTLDAIVFKTLQEETGYPKLKFAKEIPQYHGPEKLMNRIWYKLFKKKMIVKKVQVDCLFPLFDVPQHLKHIRQLIFWIPDLQEKYLPEFFDTTDIALRNNRYENMIASNNTIVFSSHSALNDFIACYPQAQNEKKVLQFAVVHPEFSDADLSSIKNKYSIMEDYFISPNQFWQHKNQVAIIEAAKILKERNCNTKIVFTGKEHDYRNTGYTLSLKQKVADYQLEENVLFLGFIDRKEQLVLMKNALGVIQPSLFEGWSTVVEDAKALNQTIIASNIAVHQEQLEDKAYYFLPNDHGELAKILQEVVANPAQKLKYDIDYTINIKRFALNFKSLTN